MVRGDSFFGTLVMLSAAVIVVICLVSQNTPSLPGGVFVCNGEPQAITVKRAARQAFFSKHHLDILENVGMLQSCG